MKHCLVNGIDVIGDDDVPDDQIWVDAPMPGGGKIRYMFTLNDHRLMRADGKGSFFAQIEDSLQHLRGGIEADPGAAADKLDVILRAMSDFKRGTEVDLDTYSDELPKG